jgi:hypothetical protein
MMENCFIHRHGSAAVPLAEGEQAVKRLGADSRPPAKQFEARTLKREMGRTPFRDAAALTYCWISSYHAALPFAQVNCAPLYRSRCAFLFYHPLS